MAVVGAYALGASGQVLSGKLLRLSLGAAFRPATTGVSVISGVLAGPPNTQGELTLLSNVALTVQPYRAVIQNTQDATAGAYVVPNDAVATLGAAQGFPAQDATQFRRALVTTYVDDAQVAGSGANQAYLTIVPGALAASAVAAALPATPNNALNLGELLVPPTGQTVTLTPYNPRTGMRHGILPVINDVSTITGHAGAPPSYDGQTRWHPVNGLEVGSGGAWGEPVVPQVLVPTFGGSYAEGPLTGGWLPLRLYKYGKRCFLAGSFTYTGGGSAAVGSFITMGSLPAGIVATGLSIAPASMSNGSAWFSASTYVDGAGSIQYAPTGSTALPGASVGRVVAAHEFRSTT